MKRYAVFTGDDYYPGGGWTDFRGFADSLEQAKEIATASKDDWKQVVDLEAGVEVEL